MEETLIQLWSRRVITRGGFVALMAVVPVIVAALISLGGGIGLLPQGLGSLTSGPSEQAAGAGIAALGRPTDLGHGVLALATASGGGSGASAFVSKKPGSGNGSAPAAAPPTGTRGGIPAGTGIGSKPSVSPGGVGGSSGGNTSPPSSPGTVGAISKLADGASSGSTPTNPGKGSDVPGALNGAATQVQGVLPSR